MTDTTPVKTAMPNWELQHRMFCAKWYLKFGSLKEIQDLFHAFLNRQSTCQKYDPPLDLEV